MKKSLLLFPMFLFFVLLSSAPIEDTPKGPGGEGEPAPQENVIL